MSGKPTLQALADAAEQADRPVRRARHDGRGRNQPAHGHPIRQPAQEGRRPMTTAKGNAQRLMAQARQDASAAAQQGDSKTAQKNNALADLIQDVINRGDYEELDANSPRRNR